MVLSSGNFGGAGWCVCGVAALVAHQGPENVDAASGQGPEERIHRIGLSCCDPDASMSGPQQFSPRMAGLPTSPRYLWPAHIRGSVIRWISVMGWSPR